MEMITSEEIKRRLWDGANELRGSMDASRYKDYMLGLMFYKFLSDKTLETYKQTNDMKEATEDEILQSYIDNYKQLGNQLINMIKQILGYCVEPEHLYQTWLKDIHAGNFEVEKVTKSLEAFESSISLSGDSKEFEGLFSTSNLDLSNTALGSNLNERNTNIKKLILLFADLNMVALQKGDVLGDAYEYLIGQFAMESGKKAGEFYTPHQVSEVMAQIVAKTTNIKSIYDPTVGSGSLLLTVKKHLDKDAQSDLNYYGQEKNTATYNLTRMNLLLHGVRPNKMTIKNGDTLSQDWPEDPEKPGDGIQFDAVVMNPPYSAKNWNHDNLKVTDPRFEFAGVLPPDSKGDYAFLLHGLYHLGTKGTMAIVLPHGVLFRGGTEGDIRKSLLEKDRIDAVIGLPSNMFTNTGIPVCILILKKNRKMGSSIMMIDSSNHFTKIGKQNVLQEKDIAKIVDTYIQRKTEKGYSTEVHREDLIKNDYNLNIARYIEPINEEIPHDVDAHLLGGIPMRDVEHLEVLQKIAPNVLRNSMKEVRANYVELTKLIDDITNEILQDSHVIEITNHLKNQIDQYIDSWWKKLRTVNLDSVVLQISEEMLNEVKQILSEFEFINVYDGYQIIAELWKNMLTHDVEFIASSDFYTAGRTRIPNMVTKGQGSKKREEQDGYTGAIVSTELIKKQLFVSEVESINKKKQRIDDIEEELNELADAAKSTDDMNMIHLSNALNDDGDMFDSKLVKQELKNMKKNDHGYEQLMKVDHMISEKATLNKIVKTEEKELRDAVENRILILTNEEIDNLMFEKWFGKVSSAMLQLINDSLNKDLITLKELQNRYSKTLSMMDQEIEELEKSLEAMLNELVICE